MAVMMIICCAFSRFYLGLRLFDLNLDQNWSDAYRVFIIFKPCRESKLGYYIFQPVEARLLGAGPSDSHCDNFLF